MVDLVQVIRIICLIPGISNVIRVAAVILAIAITEPAIVIGNLIAADHILRPMRNTVLHTPSVGAIIFTFRIAANAASYGA